MSHWTAHTGHGNRDLNIGIVTVYAVNQTQIDDINTDFGIEHQLEAMCYLPGGHLLCYFCIHFKLMRALILSLMLTTTAAAMFRDISGPGPFNYMCPGDLYPKHLRTTLKIGPIEFTITFVMELIVKGLRIMIIYQDKSLVFCQSIESPENSRVFLRGWYGTNIKFI